MLVNPGARVLIRMPLAPRSLAKTTAQAVAANLDAAYTAAVAVPLAFVAADPRLIIDPPEGMCETAF